MKGRVIIFDLLPDKGVRAALMVDGRLEDLIFSAPDAPNADDIAAVTVTRVLPKSGAFCALAGGAEGYLREARGLKPGQRLLAQVVSLPEPGKAVTLTTRLLYKGPRLILTPGAPGVNVSRRIGNGTERERLSAAVETALADLSVDPVPGVIIRSAARGEEASVLARELETLIGAMRERDRELSEPGKSYSAAAGAPIAYALREWTHPLPDQIVSSPSLYPALSAAAGQGPDPFFGDERLRTRVRAERDPFDALGATDALTALASAEVNIGPSSMIVEATRALVAVDVNTGSDFSPAAGLKTNLAVARELPRQLRLRGLGGKIAVDFAPMQKNQRRTLEEALGKAFREDPVETSLVGWTALGLYEIQRKRERRQFSVET